jgi:hypothetical protein
MPQSTGILGGKSGDYQEVRGHQHSWGGSSAGQYKLLSNGSLLLQNVREEHEGFYLCHASNGVGEGIDKVIQLHVNCKSPTLPFLASV